MTEISKKNDISTKLIEMSKNLISINFFCNFKQFVWNFNKKIDWNFKKKMIEISKNLIEISNKMIEISKKSRLKFQINWLKFQTKWLKFQNKKPKIERLSNILPSEFLFCGDGQRGVAGMGKSEKRSYSSVRSPVWNLVH